MDNTFVPSSTSIKRNRCHNINNDRLWRRRAHLIWQIETQGHNFPNRIDFVMRAAELRYIEDELVARGSLNQQTRRTTH